MAGKNVFSAFSGTRQRTVFYVFLPPTRPRDVIYDVHGLPRSTSETPRRRPSSVVYVRVLIYDTHDNASPIHHDRRQRAHTIVENFAPLKGSFASLERGSYAPFDGIPSISLRSKSCL